MEKDAAHTNVFGLDREGLAVLRLRRLLLPISSPHRSAYDDRDRTPARALRRRVAAAVATEAWPLPRNRMVPSRSVGERMSFSATKWSGVRADGVVIERAETVCGAAEVAGVTDWMDLSSTAAAA